MTKVYKANSVVHIVVVVNGKSRRVSFIAKTGGGSSFRTDDEVLQKAIESHYKFNELFRLAETIEDKKPKKAVIEAKTDKEPLKPEDGENGNPSDEEQETENPETEQEQDEDDEEQETENPETEQEQDEDDEEQEAGNGELTQVTVTDFEDARDYLSDKFGISRTKIRSQKAVIEAAKARGIVFIGL